MPLILFGSIIFVAMAYNSDVKTAALWMIPISFMGLMGFLTGKGYHKRN